MKSNIIECMINEYIKTNPIRFHMPGHKGKLNPSDVTEIGSIDNLYNNNGCYKKAQEALSKSYNSEHSFFTVNGSSGSIIVMIKYASIIKKGPLILPRNSHISAFRACALYDVDTIVIENTYNIRLKSFIHDEDKIIKAISQNPGACGIFITSPDYYGRNINIKNIAECAAQNDILVLLDEAHGAHFNISDALPESVSKHADIFVQSPHKTLSALTQGGFLHINERIDYLKTKNILEHVQTTSPSHILLKSLDNSRAQKDSMEDEWTKRAESAQRLSDKIDGLRNIDVCSDRWANECGYIDKDITRLVIDVSRIDCGIKIADILEKRYNIYLEMATFSHIVAILTPWDDKCWDDILFNALMDISTRKARTFDEPTYKVAAEKYCSISKAFSMTGKYQTLDDAIGMVCLDSLGIYPPGIPIILPGEIISSPAVKYIKQAQEHGAYIFGEFYNKISCISRQSMNIS